MGWTTIKDEQYPSYDFSKEKVLEGTMTEKRTDVGPNNSKLFVVERADKSKVSVWGSAVLNRLDKVAVGTKVRIEYVGEVKGKGPKPYKNYTIQIDEDTIPADAVAAEVFK